MNLTGFLFLFAMLVVVGLMTFPLFFIGMLTKFEVGNIGKEHLCRTLNKFVVPEIIVHSSLAVVFLLFGQWLAFIFNAPMVFYDIRQIQSKRPMFDVHDILQTRTRRRLPSRYKYQSLARVLFYMLSFFFYLYRIILALLQE
ncbi:cornichon [Mycena crocata]|nr:cornichon [Mycena crocata]